MPVVVLSRRKTQTGYFCMQRHHLVRFIATMRALFTNSSSNETAQTRHSHSLKEKKSYQFSRPPGALLLLGRFLLALHLLPIAEYDKTPHLGTRAARLFAPVTHSISFFTAPFAKTVWKFPLATLFVVAIFGSLFYGMYSVHEFIFKNLPDPSQLVNKEQAITTRILDRNGEILFRIYEDENRTLIPLDEIPKSMINATIAIEDQDFYSHHGFSARGILRAAIANYRGEDLQGGSTLTQQLVKTRLLTSERTIQRKIKELILAVLVENAYSKDEILEMYLNQVAYGGTTYGVEEAAQQYFGKSARELTLAESSILAGLPAAPSAYTPFGPNPQLAISRQEEVLRRMVEEEFITTQEAMEARQQPLKLRENVIDITAPHFVMYVRSLLAEEYGEDVLQQGGLEVLTSLDTNLQNAAQKIVTDEVTSLERLRVSNGASLITNPTTGEILAMVGSKNYFDFEHDGQVNVTIRPRQPGSSIKPLTYALAFENGYTPSSVIQDAPITYNIAGSPPYSPKNYDGKYHGNVTLREALASSYNIPAVKLLASLGVSKLLDKGELMGISTWGDRSRFGLSLTLGGGEVLMTELSQVYGAFANGGYKMPLNPILRVTKADGTIVYENTCALYNEDCPRERVLDERVAYLMAHVLSDNAARTPAFGPQSTLNIPGQEVAVKTGTTNNLRDNWTIGFTSDRVVSVWVGNNDNTPMSYVASGITGASPIWNETIRLVLSDENPHVFPVPDGVVKATVCTTTNTLTCRGCPKTTEEVFIQGTQPSVYCDPRMFTKPRPNSDSDSNSDSDQPRDRILQGVQTNSTERQSSRSRR